MSGHDVQAVVEDSPGAADAHVLAMARRGRRVLLTNDKGFAELVFRRRMNSYGILLLRLGDWNADQKALRLIDVLRDGPRLHRALLVVTARNERRRAFEEPA